MELIDSQQLAYLIENLTTSGSQELDKANLKKLKSICKKSDEHVHHVYHLLITQLERDHSEIRLAVLALIDELFQRSHIFRELLLDNFNDFIELTAETNFDMPLPDPRSAAKKLIRKAVQCVEAWNKKFGPAYRKLSLGYEYLKGTKKVQLVHADEVQTEIQRNAQEERRRRRDLVNTKRLDKAMKDIDIYSPDIENCVAEMESCFMMLVPKLDDENEGIDEDDVPDDVDSGLGTSNVMHGSGLISLDYSIQLDLSQDVLNTITVKKSMNTTDLIDNLKDREKMLKNLYLPKIKRWMASLGACGAPSDTLKRIIDLKRLVSKTLEKSQELLVVSSTTTDEQDNIDAKHSSDEDEDSDSDNSSDDDFIEVLSKPVVVFRENNSASTSGSSKNKQHFPNPNNNDAAASKDTNIWKPIRNDDNVADPASYMRALKVQKEILKSKTKDDKPKAAKLKKLHPKKSSKSSDGIEKIEFPNAPVVSFGPDLLEWDPTMKQELKETLSMGSAKELDIGHRFWSRDTNSKGDEGVSEAALIALTTRSIAFPGEFEPVKWRCRAPLPTGRLCPRQDRHKCPLHGPIIARDLNGNPSEPGKCVLALPSTSKTPDWQDPALLKELKASTGIDLKMPEKGRKRKTPKKKYENLTDVKALKNTSRSRLQNKVFDPKSLKRIADTVEKIETKRNFQKFGNNFNYALN